MKIRRLLVLVSVLVVCLVLLTLQTRGYGASAGEAVAFVTTPIQTAIAAIPRAAVGLWSVYVDWKGVRAENRRLRDEIRRLRVEALWVTEATEENRRLRRLLELRNRLPVATLTGEVIAREWGGWVRSLTIGRGRQDGVTRLMAVITPAGLVGRVVEVRHATAIVQLLTDPASTVGAHVVGTRTAGILEGQARGTMRFKFMARDGAGLKVGDLVVTSGVGGLIPRGLPIGRIQSIDDRGSALFHFAALTPVVDLSRLEDVLVVMNQGGAPDLTAFFRPGDK